METKRTGFGAVVNRVLVGLIVLQNLVFAVPAAFADATVIVGNNPIRSMKRIRKWMLSRVWTRRRTEPNQAVISVQS